MYGMKKIISGAAFLAQLSFAMADLEACEAEVEALYMDKAGILALATVRLAQDYNETCHDDELCITNMDPQTMDYLSSTQYNNNPTVPDVPIIADVDAEFVGFEDHPTWKAYVDTCEMVGGKVCRVDVDTDFKGAAIDLVEIDLDFDTHHMPFCMTDACDGVDLETVAEAVVKKAIITQVDDLDEKQAALVQTLTLKQICDGLGITECKFVIENIDCSGAPLSPVLIKKTTPSSSSVRKVTHSIAFLTGLASFLVTVF